ncbi:unnamed protein product [Lupinus luteus]|uniref:Uncharacterized protein n=1 Tax=Lupinus luteus TaxID=3873 RepID=A0AAV1XJY4_LUPLU
MPTKEVALAAPSLAPFPKLKRSMFNVKLRIDDDLYHDAVSNSTDESLPQK